MTSISTSIVNSLIAESIKNGKSKEFIIEDSKVPYLRMLISKYNKANKTKISAKRVHGVYMEICAPKDRFFDKNEFEPAFNIIQAVMDNESFVISNDQLNLIKETLKSIEKTCEERLKQRENFILM